MKAIGKIFTLLILSTISGCRKFVNVPAPTTELVSSVVFANDQSAKAALSGIYSSIMQDPTSPFSGGGSSIGLLCGMAADELKNYSSQTEPGQFYQNSISPRNSLLVNNLWGSTFGYIYAINSLLEGVPASNNLPDETRTHLIGEAKFLRAFCYSYLISLFDSIPLITATNYLSNSGKPRSTISDIEKQMDDDLQGAAQAFADIPDQAGSSHPGLAAAEFLEARLALYRKDWVNAEKYCNLILNSGTFSLNPDLNGVFLKESPETVWQLMPVVPGGNTWDGDYFILEDFPSLVALDSTLLFAFESGDMRRNDWIDSISVSGQTFYFAYKYKIKTGMDVSEYQVVFRLGELLLIRAEAEANQGDIVSGDADINQIRNRAGLPPINSSDLSSFQTHLIHERQIELFTEWGNRWFDLKRLNLSDQTLGPLKGSNWQSTDVWFPIPQPEIQKDPYLTQNAGY